VIGSSLTLAYLIAAPGALNPAAPEEAAAAGSCTTHDRTLSVRAGGGRYFVPRCDYYFQNLSASASCGTVTPSSFYGYLVTRFDADSCLGPATFTWQVDGMPYVENMNIEPNGNEPPECGPAEPGTTVGGIGIEAGLSIPCSESDFDESGLDQLRSSTTDPAHGSVVINLPFSDPLGGSISYQYKIDFAETLLVRRCDDSFAITIGDDYSPNPKSLPPINVFVDNHAQRPPGNCPMPGGEPTGQRDAQIKKCKKKFPGEAKAKKRKKCKKKANLLPV
jgi:hypothetical protein